MRRLIKVSAYIAVVGLVVTASLSALTSSAFAEKTATKKSDEQKTAKYVGSSETKKYHRASCEFVKKIVKGHRVEFSSPEQAQKAGYTPCKVCTPSATKKSSKAKSGTTSTASEKSATNNATTKKSASQ